MKKCGKMVRNTITKGVEIIANIMKFKVWRIKKMTLTERAKEMNKLYGKRINRSTTEWFKNFICEWEDITKKLRKYDCSKIKIIHKEDK